MEFLMAAFRRQLSGYGYNFTLKCVKGNYYILEFVDLPVKLDVILCKLKYKQYTYTKDGEDHFIEVPVCLPTVTKNSHRIIHAEFDTNTYAQKINMIDHAIRAYHEEENSVYIH